MLDLNDTEARKKIMEVVLALGVPAVGAAWWALRKVRVRLGLVTRLLTMVACWAFLVLLGYFVLFYQPAKEEETAPTADCQNGEAEPKKLRLGAGKPGAEFAGVGRGRAVPEVEKTGASEPAVAKARARRGHALAGIGRGGPAPRWRFLSAADVAREQRQHLEGLAPHEKASQRYLSLAHWHNDPDVSPEDLALARLALRRTVERLSKPNFRSQCQPIDPDQVVFAVNFEHPTWAANWWQQYAVPCPVALETDWGQAQGCAALLSLPADWLIAAVEERLAGAPGRAGKSSPEIKFVVSRYRQPVGPRRLACELGVTQPWLLAAAIEASPGLQALGLAPLARGEKIARSTWEGRRGAASPCQELARELGLGAAHREP